jgi:hypothetical protein
MVEFQTSIEAIWMTRKLLEVSTWTKKTAASISKRYSYSMLSFQNALAYIIEVVFAMFDEFF